MEHHRNVQVGARGCRLSAVDDRRAVPKLALVENGAVGIGERDLSGTFHIPEVPCAMLGPSEKAESLTAVFDPRTLLAVVRPTTALQGLPALVVVLSQFQTTTGHNRKCFSVR